MKKRLAATSILMMITISAAGLGWAEKWVQVKEGSEDSASLFVDRDNITEKDGLRFFVLQSIMVRPEEKKEADRRNVAFLKHPVDCTTRSIYPPLKVQVIDGKGKLLRSIDQKLEKVIKTKKSIYELPGGENVFGVVCADDIHFRRQEAIPEAGQRTDKQAE